MIKDILLWALSKFTPSHEEKIEAWSFPVLQEKRRPQVKKATTRKVAVKKPVAKKATKVAKKTTVKNSPLLKVMKQEQKEVKKVLKQKAKQ